MAVETMINWIPTVLACGALGGVVVMNRISRKDAREEVDSSIVQIQAKVKLIESEFLPEDKHALLCENKTLKIEQHITQEITCLKDETFMLLREIQGKINKINKDGVSINGLGEVLMRLEKKLDEG